MGRSRALKGAGALLALFALVLVIFGVLGGSSSRVASARGTAGPALVVDVWRGSVGGFAVGDDVRRAPFGATGGPPTSDRDSALPIGADADEVGGPANYAFPRPCDREQRDEYARGTLFKLGVREVRFPGVAVSACRDRAFLIVATSRGTRTTEGAQIDQPLKAAASRYRSLKCATSNGATTPPRPVYEYCTGRIAPGRYIWLGQDPVSSIAVSTVRMG